MEKMSEELKPGVSKKRVIEESSSSGEEIDPSCIADELLQKYASEMPSKIPMTISKELFYSNAMVQREYEHLSEEDNVVLLHCGCLSLNPFIEFSIQNNSSSSDVLNIQASISPRCESK